MIRIGKYIAPTVLYCGLLFYMSGMPGHAVPNIPFSDKVFHLLTYLVLGFLFARSLSVMNNYRFVRDNVIWLSILFCTFYGITDEIHQLFVERRSFEFGDMIADSAGGALGALIFSMVRGITDAGHIKWATRLF